ncbi:MAG: GGDEF domain-containing protein [Gammaproteobacteria bacterium]|nr:GGDEF domain-containing protein [Gammaproteobacteria bacterium]
MQLPDPDNAARSASPERGFDAWGGFEAWARLLKVLLPSLCAMCVQDGDGRQLWASVEWAVDEAAAQAVAAAATAAALTTTGEFPAAMRVVNADVALYAFALPRDHGRYGTVMLALAPTGSPSGPRALPYVQSMVAPALACWRGELSLRTALAERAHAAIAAAADAHGRAPPIPAPPLAVDSRDADEGDERDENQDGDAIDRWLERTMHRGGATLAALWVPERRISRTLTPSGQPLAPAALQRAEQHLLAWVRLQQRTLVVNRIARTATADAAPYKILASPVRHRSGRILGALALFNPPSAADFPPSAVAAIEAAAKRLSGMIDAAHDPRTGLLTEAAFARGARRVFATGAPLGAHSLLYLDVDRLRALNEAFGMSAGDEAIAAAAACLQATLPADALCARLTGDRLAALLPNTNVDAAIANAERVRAAYAARGGAAAPSPTLSIGVAPVADVDEPLAHALAAAEDACKSAKALGGDRVAQAQERGTGGHAANAAVARLLGRALATDEPHLIAQPILPLRGDYGGALFEVLLRLPGERGELLTARKVLPVARACGLMRAVDRWVVRGVCALLGAHARRVGEERACFTVNLDAESLLDDSFVGFVEERIAADRVPRGALGFEISEALAARHPDATRRCIDVLRGSGCRFILDDFGTGAGTLGILREFAVEALKIDGAIVRDAIEDPRSAAMIKAVAQLATVMRLRTIAEHVESDALRCRIADLGVDYGQGFAVARAVPLRDLLGELALFEASAEPRPHDDGLL